MTTPCAEWRDLGAEFRALAPNPRNALSARQIDGKWLLMTFDQAVVNSDDQLLDLATRAGNASGVPVGRDPLDWWLRQLTKNKRDEWVKDPISASAKRCSEFVTKVLELE